MNHYGGIHVLPGLDKSGISLSQQEDRRMGESY